MKRLLCLAALSVVFTLAFLSVAMAQQTGGEDNLFSQPSFGCFPDAGGCLLVEPQTQVARLNAPLVDPNTGEELGLLKNLDPDLSSGDFSITYQEFCGDFPQPESLIVGTTLGGLVAQEYYDQLANVQEQAILDPNGDGLACTAEDTAFLAGDTSADQYGQQLGEQSAGGQPEGQPQPLVEQPQPDDQMQTLPDTGGSTFLVLVVALLVGSGFFGLFAATRRRA